MHYKQGYTDLSRATKSMLTNYTKDKKKDKQTWAQFGNKFISRENFSGKANGEQKWVFWTQKFLSISWLILDPLIPKSKQTNFPIFSPY